VGWSSLTVSAAARKLAPTTVFPSALRWPLEEAKSSTQALSCRRGRTRVGRGPLVRNGSGNRSLQRPPNSGRRRGLCLPRRPRAGVRRRVRARVMDFDPSHSEHALEASVGLNARDGVGDDAEGGVDERAILSRLPAVFPALELKPNAALGSRRLVRGSQRGSPSGSGGQTAPRGDGYCFRWVHSVVISPPESRRQATRKRRRPT